MNIRLTPPEELIETTVRRLPLSKSVAARVLILHAITPGARALDVSRLPACDDIQVLSVALATGTGELSMGQSGTAARFLTAHFAAREGCEVTLTAAGRLAERPVGPLVDALRDLGADITYLGREGCLPLAIRGRQLSGGRVTLKAGDSSQYASALALAAPLMSAPLEIDLGGEIASLPYLKMTLSMLVARGVEAFIEGYTVHVDAATCRDVAVEAEPDWSAAAFWYEMAAVTAGWFTLPGLRADSLQGDSVLARMGERMGVLTEFTDEGVELSATPDMFSRFDMDLHDYPDLVPAVAVAGCLVNVPYRLTGIGHLRLKESDRLATLAAELARCGWIVEAGPDYLEWEGVAAPVTELPRMHSHDDHRLAMAFAAIGAFVPGLVIEGAEAVNKSYPGFWDDLADAGFTVEYLDMEEDDSL